MNDACLELQKDKKDDKSSCEFYRSEPIQTFSQHAMAKAQDIEELMLLGKKLHACGYYGSRAAVPNAELVVLPYTMLLHKATRESLGISLKDNIIILDEAHNIMEAVNNMYSVEITLAQVQSICC
jgi:chromosome transmission fidelity protein 1